MPRRFLPDHARAQHQLVRDDLRVGGRLPEGRQEVAGKAHERPCFRVAEQIEAG